MATENSKYGPSFLIAVGNVLREEGGYVNDPKDAGGETNFGISKRAYPDVDIKNLRLEDAREIYFRDYWSPLYGDSLPQPIAHFLFDAAVNHGLRLAVKMAQVAAGMHPDDCDGIMGLKTRAVLEQMSIPRFIERYAVCRLRTYRVNPAFDTFGEGWLLRLIRTIVRVSR